MWILVFYSSTEHQIEPVFNASVINNKASNYVIQTTKQVSMSKSSAEVHNMTFTKNDPMWSWLKHSQSVSEAFKKSNRHQASVKSRVQENKYKNLASVYNISNKQQYQRDWIQSEQANMLTHIKLSQILTNLILSSADDMVNIKKQILLTFKCIFNMHMKWLSSFN